MRALGDQGLTSLTFWEQGFSLFFLSPCPRQQKHQVVETQQVSCDHMVTKYFNADSCVRWVFITLILLIQKLRLVRVKTFCTSNIAGKC